MPATSIVQQRLFGMALCYKRGECKNVPKEAKDLANEMTLKQLEDFAKTSHSGLPYKKENKLLTFKQFLNEKTLKI